MKCTLLTKDEVCNNQLQIFKKYGTNAAVTDFSLLLGIEVSSNHTSDSLYYRDKVFEDTRAADYWTRTKEETPIAISSYSFGFNSPKNINNLYIGIRPVLKYAKIINETYDKKITDKEILEVKYGEYPQTVCEDKTNLELEKLYKEGKLEKTEKIYTINSNKTETFFPQKIIEYTYNGKKYIRFIADRDTIRTKLSNKKYIEYNRPYWIKVEPIIWMIDEKQDIAVSKKLLITGIPFDENYNNTFEETNIYKYLNEYFIKEIKTENNELEKMSLRELQELKLKIEKQMKEEAKIKKRGGII